MGYQGLTVLTAFLLFTKAYEVSTQYATVVECLPQLTATIARPIVQSGGQFILPAIIQPIIPGYDSYARDQAGYPNYGNCPAPYPGYPPIIVKDNDNMWRNLLFMMLAMRGKRDTYCNTPPSYGRCNSCDCERCRCCGDCPYCKKNSKDSESSSPPIYIPIPIAIPVYTGPDGCRYIDGFCDDILIQESSGQGKEPNEINLIIRTDC